MGALLLIALAPTAPSHGLWLPSPSLDCCLAEGSPCRGEAQALTQACMHPPSPLLAHAEQSGRPQHMQHWVRRKRCQTRLSWMDCTAASWHEGWSKQSCKQPHLSSVQLTYWSHSARSISSLLPACIWCLWRSFTRETLQAGMQKVIACVGQRMVRFRHRHCLQQPKHLLHIIELG